MIRKLALTGIGFALLLSPIVASAQSTDIQTQIAALQAQVKLLLARIAQLQGQTTRTDCVNLSSNLTLGSTGTDVTNLQNYLIKKGYLNADYSTGYYGFLTAQAVGKLQVAMGIVSSNTDTAYGLLGPKTRGAIGCGSTPVTIAKSSIKVDVDGSTFLTVAYYNLPAESRLFLVDANNIDLNTDINNRTAVSGTGGIEYDAKAMEPGYYYVEAMVRTTTDLSVARSSTFYLGINETARPSCTLSAKPYTLVTGEESTLSWTSANAVKAKWQQDTAANVLGLSADVLPVSGSETVTVSGKGSQTAILLVTASNGTTASCGVTLQIESSTTVPSATIDSSSLTTSSNIPIITGTAINASYLSVSVYGYDGEKSAYNDGLTVSVVNGKWSTKPLSYLPFGMYTVKVFDTAKGNLLASEGLVVREPLAACPVDATAKRGQNGSTYACMCPANSSSAVIRGGGPVGTASYATYTDDSDICTAGAQVGQMNLTSGGEVDYTIRPGQSSYTGFTQNGITSQSYYDSWPGSFQITGPKG